MQDIDHFKMERDDIAERLESEKRMNQKMMSALKTSQEGVEVKDLKAQVGSLEN